MKRNFRVVTEARFCKETGRPPTHNKPFGYVLQITPPIVCFQRTDDVEGVGLVRYNPPRRWEQHVVGWYKYKSDALKRLPYVSLSDYWNRPDATA